MSDKDDEDDSNDLTPPKGKQWQGTGPKTPKQALSGSKQAPRKPRKPRAKKTSDTARGRNFSAMIELPPSDEVGYGQPPRDHQFKSGVSGNPRGRPIGAKTRRYGSHGHRLYDCLNAELERQVKYTEDGQQRTMSVLQAIVRTMSAAAAKGSTEAARIILPLARDRDNYERRQNERMLEMWGTYKAEVNAGIRAMGPNPTPAQLARIPLPHPDHINIDTSTCEILISGPQTETERDALEHRYRMREAAKGALAWVASKIKAARSPKRLVELRDMQKQFEEKLAYYNDILGDGGGEEGGGKEGAA